MEPKEPPSAFGVLSQLLLPSQGKEGIGALARVASLRPVLGPKGGHHHRIYVITEKEEEKEKEKEKKEKEKEEVRVCVCVCACACVVCRGDRRKESNQSVISKPTSPPQS